jgi:hypothetical protein
VIAVAAASVLFVDWLALRFVWPSARVASMGGAFLLVLLAGLELTTSGIYGLKTYSITERAKAPVTTDYGTRLGIELVDHRGIGAALAELRAPQDRILRANPLSVSQYTGERGHLLLQTWTVQKVLFDPRGERARYMDVMTGHPVLRNRREWNDVLGRNARVWIVEPANYFSSAMDADFAGEFYLRSKLVAETYNVRLIDWSR